MKRALILHGTDANPEANWFPWIKVQLERRGYEVWVPLLPNNHTPNRHAYNDLLFGSDWDLTDNLVIGHSSGAVSALNLLGDERSPHVRTAVMVGVWAHMEGTELDHEQFKDLFPAEGFNFEAVKRNTDHILYLHGSDDPHCPIAQARWLHDQTGGDFVEVPGGHHLGQRFRELPQLIAALEERGWL